MTIWDDMIDAVYDSEIGVSATFDIAETEPITVIDKTGGVEVAPQGRPGLLPTVQPALCVRNTSLVSAGISSPEYLVGTHVEVNGVTWSIISYRPRTLPTGELTGEYYLYLRKP